MNNNFLKIKIDEVETRRNHYQEFKKYMPYQDKILWANKKIVEFLEYCIRNNEHYITFLLICIKKYIIKNNRIFNNFTKCKIENICYKIKK